MKHPRALFVGIVLILGVVGYAWPHVDREASRIVLAASGLTLILAWYSILDLREQRHERLWPHTVDRLVRATFTSSMIGDDGKWTTFMTAQYRRKE